MYEFSTCDIVGRDPHAYLYVSVHWITHAAVSILSSISGLYDPSKTRIRVIFIIDYEIHASSDSHSILSYIYVSTHYFHMSSSHYGVLFSGAILSDAPWYLTWSSIVCSIDSIIIHSNGWFTCFCHLYFVSNLVLLTDIWEVYIAQPVVSFT